RVTFDSQKASRKKPHSILAAIENRFPTYTMKSFLKSGTISGTLNNILALYTAFSKGNEDAYDGAEYLAAEVVALDNIIPEKEKFPRVVVAAALIALRFN